MGKHEVKIGAVHSVAEMRSAAEGAEQQTKLCALSLLPLVDADSGPLGGARIVFCGLPYYASCVNFWINRISVNPPETNGMLVINDS